MKYFQIYSLLCFALLVSSQNLEFTQQPEAVYYAHTNVPLVIQCISTGTTIAYRRDNTLVRTTTTNEAYTQNTPIEGTDGSEEGIEWDCQASNDDGVIVSSRAIVYWARFVDTGTAAQDAVTIRQTVIAYLPCNFFNGSLPPPVIGWEKNDTEISDPNILPGTNSLLLQPSEAADNDRYRCVLLNKYGDPNSRTQATTEYLLDVVTKDIHTFPFLAFPSSDFTSTVGDTIHFECIAYIFSCVWQRNTGGDNWENLLPVSTLYSEVVTADILTMYRAIVAGEIQSTRTLTIYQLPEVVSSIGEDFIEYEQQTISINCQRSGVPDPTLDIYKDSVLVQNQTNKYALSTADNTTTLEIQNLQDTDTGYYTCRADNPEASAAASGKITVRVALTPTFTQHPIPASITSGTDFSISCTARGDPLPEIEWTFIRSGQTTVLTNSAKHSINESTDQVNQSRTSLLTVSSITAKNNGDYLCVGENFKATVESLASTVLIPSDPVIESVFSSSTVEILEEEMYFQDCVAYAEPPPTVRWYLSAVGEISTNTPDYVIYPNNTLVVTGNRQLSGRTFTCTATNLADSVSRSFTLLINSCPVVEVTPTGPLNSVEHVNATLTCRANGLPAPTYGWVYRPIGSSELGSLPSTHTGVSVVDDYTVIISPISVANEGSYCCMAVTDELNDTCGVELVCVEVQYEKNCVGLHFCLFELWQLIVIVVAAFVLILLIFAALFCVVFLICRHFRSHTYNINRAAGLSMPYSKERRDDDSDDDGEFDPTYESLPANKSTHPPMYKQAPYYGGGDDSGLPAYNPPPQTGGDTTSLPLDGVLGPPAFSYPPPIDMHHASMPMLPGNFAHAPEMYTHDFMQPHMYPGDMKPQLEEFLSTDGQFV